MGNPSTEVKTTEHASAFRVSDGENEGYVFVIHEENDVLMVQPLFSVSIVANQDIQNQCASVFFAGDGNSDLYVMVLHKEGHGFPVKPLFTVGPLLHGPGEYELINEVNYEFNQYEVGFDEIDFYQWIGF